MASMTKRTNDDVTEARVHELPRCDFCENKAQYDAKTMKGPWAFMCERHWAFYGCQKLGLGKGQRLIAD